MQADLQIKRRLARSLLAVGRAVGTEQDPTALRCRALIVAPHPDDEILGCGGTIAKKLRSGARVQILVLTDGAASHSDLISPADLAKMRRAECLEAGSILGLSADQYYFLDLPDQQLRDHEANAVTGLQNLLSKFRPEQVYVPHHRDRLADHVATNNIVRHALRHHRAAVTVFEYPIWLWHTWPWTSGRRGEKSFMPTSFASQLVDVLHLVVNCRTRVNITSVRDLKRSALRAYRSQLERPAAQPGWPTLGDVSGGEFMACFDLTTEIFYEWNSLPAQLQRGGADV